MTPGNASQLSEVLTRAAQTAHDEMAMLLASREKMRRAKKCYLASSEEFLHQAQRCATLGIEQLEARHLLS